MDGFERLESVGWLTVHDYLAVDTDHLARFDSVD